MIATKLRPHLDKLLLGSIFLVLSTSTVVWTLRDRTPPAWDPADHMRYAYDYYRLLANADFAVFAREFFTAPHYYAPLVLLNVLIDALALSWAGRWLLDRIRRARTRTCASQCSRG